MDSNTENPAHGQPTIPITDVAFDLVGDARRRCALSFLLETDGPVALTTLAEHVAAGVAGPDDSVSAADVEAMCVSLRHSHLPRMEDVGVVEYDPDESMVASTRLTEAFDPFFSVVEGWDHVR